MKLAFLFLLSFAQAVFATSLMEPSCQLAKEEFLFPYDASNEFFPHPSNIYCKKLANGMVVNMPLRETEGHLLYTIGTAPLTKLNVYLAKQGAKVRAKANADDPTKGTVRVAYYDMKTSVGPFHSLAVTIVTESGNLPAAFHYAQYYAHELANQQYGIFNIGVNKVQTPLSSNLRDFFEVNKGDVSWVAVQAGRYPSPLFYVGLEVPKDLKYQFVKSLAYSTTSNGATSVGGVGPQTVMGTIRGSFSTVIPKKDAGNPKLIVRGPLAHLLSQLGFLHTGFQLVKNFDLVER